MQKKMKVVILAGGLGTRLSEKTGDRPKPMVEIGGHPILWHIMNIYSHYGYREFVIALGYKGEMIKSYFLNFYALNNNLSLDLRQGEVTIHQGDQPDWTVHLVDTGAQTQTGGRLRRLRDWLPETFMMTYGDGLANVNIDKLVDFHRSEGKLATVTAVRPPARFGNLLFEGNHVVEFQEKPQAGEGWINGGFFVLEPQVIDSISGDEMPWEKAPLEDLSTRKQLVAYRHDGFWQPMDTLREHHALETLWESEKAPWKIWT